MVRTRRLDLGADLCPPRTGSHILAWGPVSPPQHRSFHQVLCPPFGHSPPRPSQLHSAPARSSPSSPPARPPSYPAGRRARSLALCVAGVRRGVCCDVCVCVRGVRARVAEVGEGSAWSPTSAQDSHTRAFPLHAERKVLSVVTMILGITKSWVGLPGHRLWAEGLARLCC